jgi:hypothetical protein
MSRQFQVYLLPSDVERLIADLKERVGVRLISPHASKPEIVEVPSAIQKRSPAMLTERSVHVDCYLGPMADPNIMMSYYANLSAWKVDFEKSEVIEFAGCDQDDSILVVGRFYYQTDMLLNNLIVPKRGEFLEWADQIFRTTKRLLTRSKELDAYVGKDAEKWRQSGGKFVSFLVPGQKIIYAGKQD